ncbi:hypothetical protein NZD89_16300 [Alicyclobacillus fastidiosus]|uniref:KARI N-terminal Rossmann domain-containing protein n=1 Tax=Alicyclobacillus fastidiosus TaxID=392011 RepID=A0ABY6ZAS4_9BACL|nr:hypothetical protein [Alicyclobacillus fastidiosus]WAH39957.1 hypothetical protein NZD89_16300 [Alicyclobacillus fastidiosus]GMA61239.1 hypothetical protein GCM10025859_16790 [Alicyclobacillus fastidiosus]
MDVSRYNTHGKWFERDVSHQSAGIESRPDASEVTGVHNELIAEKSGKTVAIFGYREDGRAHAEHLRQVGVRVIFGIREDRDEWSDAIRDGEYVVSPEEAAAQADIIQVW